VDYKPTISSAANLPARLACLLACLVSDNGERGAWNRAKIIIGIGFITTPSDVPNYE
jgi:hypothetical protein